VATLTLDLRESDPAVLDGEDSLFRAAVELADELTDEDAVRFVLAVVLVSRVAEA